MIKEKLKLYFQEAQKHIEKIDKAKEVLNKHYPFNIDTLEELEEFEKDKLDVLAFRFAKLQDLMGEKIFRNILNLMGYNTQRPFIEILAELEREEILNTQTWIALRNARNSISHEYPYMEENLIEAINFLLENSDYLKNVFYKLKRLFDEIVSKRN
ncbi:hypothetical protein [Caminibacter sp.]